MGIHNEILTKILAGLTKGMITDLADDDLTKAGVVMIGQSQGDPAPDVPRISVNLFTNDPDAILGNIPTGMKTDWEDMVYNVEVGPAITHWRRFVVKCRCLFSYSREDQPTSLGYADTVRDRIETLLMAMNFGTVHAGTEYVARPILADDIKSEMLQAGGPPDQFDYLIKIRFSVLTTRTGV